MIIYDFSGKALIDADINEGGVRKYELMKEDYIKVVFSLNTCVPVRVGCYVDFSSEFIEGVNSLKYPHLSNLWRFEATSDYVPTYNNETGGYDYDLQLDSYYMSWKNKIFKYLPKDAGQESSWSLTDTPDKFCKIIEQNLNARGLMYKEMPFHACVDEELNTKAITLSFSNTSILDALTSIAQAVNEGRGCDWWVEGNYVKFGIIENNYSIDGRLLRRAAKKESLKLLLGENMESCQVNNGQVSKATRIYAYGSEKNITKFYRKELRFTPSFDGKSYFRDSFRTNVPARCYRIEDSDYSVAYFYNYLSPISSSIDLKTPYQEVLAQKTVPCIRVVRIKENVSTVLGTGLVVAGFLSRKTFNDIGAKAVITFYKKEGDRYINVHSKTVNLVKDKEIPDVDDKDRKMFVAVCSSFGDEFYVHDGGLMYYTIEVKYDSANVESVTAIGFGTLECGKKIVKKLIEIECYGADGKYLGNETVSLNAKQTGDEEEEFSWLSGTLLNGTSYYKIPSLIRSEVNYSYFTNSAKEEDAVNAVVTTRLMLPQKACFVKEIYFKSEHTFDMNDIHEVKQDGDVCIYDGHGYVDAELGLKENSIIEEVDTFNDVYPSVDVLVTDAWLDRQEAEKWEDDNTETGNVLQVWQMRTDLTKFSNKFRIDSSKRYSVTFKSGKLSGMTFEVEYIKDKSTDENAVLEIIRNDNYTVSLPNDLFHPQKDDKFNLFNYDVAYMDEELTPKAEKKLLAETLNLIQERKRDDKTYNVTLMSDWVYNDGAIRSIALGQRVVIEEFSNTSNRVIGIEYPLDIPYDSPMLIVGKSSAYSRFKDLQQQIESLDFQGTTYVNNDNSIKGNSVYLIGLGDLTEASDSNAYSALRTNSVIEENIESRLSIYDKQAKEMFLRKDAPDTASSIITFDQGLVSNAPSAMKAGATFGDGASIDKDGRATLVHVKTPTADISEAEIERANITNAIVRGSVNVDGYQESGAQGTLIDDGGIKTRKAAKMRTVVFGDYQPGLVTGAEQGARIHESGHGDFRSLSISEFLEVPEIRFNRATVYVGMGIRSEGGGVIEEAVADSDVNGEPLNGGRAALRLENGEIGAIDFDDYCLGFWHNLSGNSTASRDDRNGDYELQGFSSVYFRIDHIYPTREAYEADDRKAAGTGMSKYFHYTLRGNEGVNGWSQNHHPVAMMHFGQIANPRNKARQNVKITTTSYELHLSDMTGWNYNSECIVYVNGDLDGFTVKAVDEQGNLYDRTLTGAGMFLSNLYYYGNLEKVMRVSDHIELDISPVACAQDNSIADGETMMVRVSMVSWAGTVQEDAVFSIARQSTDSAADETWNSARGKDIAGGSIALTYGDLGNDADVLFLISATRQIPTSEGQKDYTVQKPLIVRKAGSYMVNDDLGYDLFFSPKETKTITFTVSNPRGVDVTANVGKWMVNRMTGNKQADTVWDNDTKARWFQDPVIPHRLEIAESDLGEGETTRFTITAYIDNEPVAVEEIEI